MGFDSYDNKGAIDKSWDQFNNNYVNAYWNGDVFNRDGNDVDAKSLAVLDIRAHEIGHAVAEYATNLIHQDESGALSDASSDVYSAMVEAWVNKNITQDVWHVGEDT